MRCLRRNQRPFYYAPFLGEVLLVDENGFDTGEYEKTFGNPVKARATISPATGEITAQQFGGNVDYDNVLLVDKTDFPLDEYARLWIDVVPVIAQNGTTETPHDYVVKRVSRSLNFASYAISKVKVNEG